MAWAWTSVIVGVLLMGGSLVPSLLNGQRWPIVLGDAELIPVFGMIPFVVAFW